MSESEDTDQRRSAAILSLLPPLLDALITLRGVQRYFDPQHAAELAAVLQPKQTPLAEALSGFRAAAPACFPGDLAKVAATLAASAETAVESLERFVSTAQGSQDFATMHRALRGYNQSIESLYLLAPLLVPVSAFLLEPVLAGDQAFIDQLRQGLANGLARDEARGVVHDENGRDQRGGYSLFVPETYDATRPAPLIVALHGGSGHGRDFLWNWLPEARSRGCLILSPTSRDQTWSFIEPPDVDKEPVLDMVAHVREHFSVDPKRILLTGMSDGATYALMLGLSEGVPFTHLAPVCGVLHPACVLDGSLARARDLPIYQVNGVVDWMFPIQTAHMARDHLVEAGAAHTFRAIEDLPHTYPRDENPNILDWLGAPLKGP